MTAWAAPVISGVVIQPHRAIYTIKMVSSRAGSPLLGIDGKMMYSLEKSCDGWISNHSFDLSYTYSENSPLKIWTKFTSFESLDGHNMQFSSERYSNGELEQSLRGSAHSGQTEAANSAVYTSPEGLVYPLTVGTLFPVEHSRKLIAAAEAGQKIFNAQVFDGSDDKGVAELNAIIGKRFDPVKDDVLGAHVDKSLMIQPSWHVELASFRDDPETNAAEYELQMTLLRNGIVKDMRVNYHDFSIEQNLVALEDIKQEECGVSTNE